MTDSNDRTVNQAGNEKTLMVRVTEEAVRDPFEGVDFSQLELSLYRPRTLFSIILSVLITCMTLIALVPLFAVLWMLLWRG